MFIQLHKKKVIQLIMYFICPKNTLIQDYKIKTKKIKLQTLSKNLKSLSSFLKLVSSFSY